MSYKYQFFLIEYNYICVLLKLHPDRCKTIEHSKIIFSTFPNSWEPKTDINVLNVLLKILQWWFKEKINWKVRKVHQKDEVEKSDKMIRIAYVVVMTKIEVPNLNYRSSIQGLQSDLEYSYRLSHIGDNEPKRGSTFPW